VNFTALFSPFQVFVRVPVLSVPFGQGVLLRIDQAHFDHPFIARFADRQIAVVINPLVFGDIGRPGLQGEVRGRIGQVEKEGFFMQVRFIQPPQGPVGEGVGGIEVAIFGSVGMVGRLVVAPVTVPFPGRSRFPLALNSGIPEIGASIPQAVVMVKPAVMKVLGAVVLAGGQSPVADRAKHLAEGGAVFHDIRPGHVRFLMVHSSQKRRTGRITFGRVVELREPDPVFGQRVDVRSPDFGTIAPDIRPSHIINEDQDDIRLFGCHRGRAGDS